ncbi:MAG: hypothetical protein IPP74_11370 [Alphaproteobacteria bacterium]|nr:hypothetical protein [Alphaproteobacteria bacterium]
MADAYAASMCHIELKSGTIVISKSDQDFANKLYQETLKTPSIGSLYADEGLIAFDNVCNADPTCRVANQDASFKALALAGITVSVFGVAGLAGGGAAGTDGFLLGEGDGLFLSAQQLELKIQTSAASLAQFLTNAYITNTLSGLDPNNPMMGTSGNNGIDLEGYSSHDGSTLPKDPGLSFPGYDNTLPGFEIPDVDGIDVFTSQLPDDWRNTVKLNDTQTWPIPPISGEFIEGDPSRAKPLSRGEKSLYDQNGGEWRCFPGDKYHNPHWDYKPSGLNQAWQNVPIGNLPTRK